MTQTIRLNGENAAVRASTVAELLAAQGIDLHARGVAVALNGALVPRRAWNETPLAGGDDVEIVRPYSGG